MNISIIEPTWNNGTHIPANLGLLRIVILAYPNATINFVGGAGQIEYINKFAPKNIIESVKFYPWPTGEDKDTLPNNVWMRIKNFRELPPEVLGKSTHIILSSCTATTLAASAILGLSKKTLAILHGNANELIGWRSKNLIRKLFDFHGAMKLFCKFGGTAIVFEESIRSELENKFQWLSNKIKCIPHPITPNETTNKKFNDFSHSIKIGFAGVASIAKGFPEFLDFAKKLNTSHPGRFEFNAFGTLPKNSKDFDQTCLNTKANRITLSRDDYVSGLRQMDFIFTWHNDKYYGLAASGIVYDAINLHVPLISREVGQISEWKKNQCPVGFTFETIEAASDYFIKNNNATISKECRDFFNNIEKIRKTLSDEYSANIIKGFFDHHLKRNQAIFHE